MKAQDKTLTPPRLVLAGDADSDHVDLQQQKFLHGVAEAVTRLDSIGDRTMDAIENSQITLTLEAVQDSTRLAVLCNNGAKDLNIFTQSLARQLQLNGRVTEAVCTGAGRDDDPFVMKFRLHYESGKTSLFYEQPPLLRFIVEDPQDDDPARVPQQEEASESSPQPARLNPRRSQSTHMVVQLSEGWSPVKLPDPVHADSPFGTLDATMTFADGTLTLDRKLILKRDKVEVAELPAFEKWTEIVQGGEDVALRSTLYYPDRDASAGTEVQKKAANLIDEAFRDIEAHAFDKAEVALNQAEAMDPGHEILHEDRGELAAARGDNVTALAEYRKELEAFPNARFEMNSIAHGQRKLGDPDGAIVTLQRWMLADPNSSLAATNLMQMYNSMGHDDLAVQVGDEAMNIMTRDARRSVDFLLTYGHEQMLTGQSRGAQSTLQSLLDLTVDDAIVNDAAYYLSEHGLALDRAEQSVREALTQFDPTKDANALSTSSADTSAERTSLLLATWDTLGWILFRKGAVKEAETYVRATWRSRQDIVISRHLGAILTAEEKPVDAMNVYTLGLSVIADHNAAQVATDPDAVAVRDAIAQLKQKGFAPTVTDPKAALLALRTLDLGNAAKAHSAIPCTLTLTASELSYTTERNEEDEPLPTIDGKLLAEFFPPNSKAALMRKGTIQCSKTCSLVFTP